MNPDYPDYIKVKTASETALQDWKRKIPVNRAGRRDQLARYKYYLELYESDTFWSVYAVKRDGNKVMVDNSANHEPKEKPEADFIDEENITNVIEEQTTQEPLE